MDASEPSELAGQSPVQGRSQATVTCPKDGVWSFWFTVPLYPYRHRRTLRKEVVSGMVWTFEQIQGIFYVVVPIRMTIVKLEAGGLLVYAPIAPTPECIRLVKELVQAHGDVRYIILPTVSGLEHKVFVGPFARQFPTAQVFVAPNQWSFPLNLPLSWLGFPRRRTHILPEDSARSPFTSEFDYAILNVDLGGRSFGEVALFHRRSRTLLVTDTVLSIPENPPDVVQLDPYPLLFHAREDTLDQVEDTGANRRKGWQRMTLFAFYFRPSRMETVDLGQAVRESLRSPDRSRKAYFGIYPFRWQEGWQRSFEALRGDGRLLVAPILQTLILNRAPLEVIDWANTIARWGFQRIIPCHFDAPIEATAHSFRRAFAFLEKYPFSSSGSPASPALPPEDLEFLQELDGSLTQSGVTPPPGEKV